jgi:hypothetical protein
LRKSLVYHIKDGYNRSAFFISIPKKASVKRVMNNIEIVNIELKVGYFVIDISGNNLD